MIVISGSGEGSPLKSFPGVTGGSAEIGTIKSNQHMLMRKGKSIWSGEITPFTVIICWRILVTAFRMMPIQRKKYQFFIIMEIVIRG